jgi:hypothetical protein
VAVALVAVALVAVVQVAAVQVAVDLVPGREALAAAVAVAVEAVEALAVVAVAQPVEAVAVAQPAEAVAVAQPVEAVADCIAARLAINIAIKIVGNGPGRPSVWRKLRPSSDLKWQITPRPRCSSWGAAASYLWGTAIFRAS